MMIQLRGLMENLLKFQREPIVKLLIGLDIEVKNYGEMMSIYLIHIVNLKILKYGIMKDSILIMYIQIDSVHLHMDQEIV